MKTYYLALCFLYLFASQEVVSVANTINQFKTFQQHFESFSIPSYSKEGPGSDIFETMEKHFDGMMMLEVDEKSMSEMELAVHHTNDLRQAHEILKKEFAFPESVVLAEFVITFF